MAGCWLLTGCCWTVGRLLLVLSLALAFQLLKRHAGRGLAGVAVGALVASLGRGTRLLQLGAGGGPEAPGLAEAEAEQSARLRAQAARPQCSTSANLGRSARASTGSSRAFLRGNGHATEADSLSQLSPASGASVPNELSRAAPERFGRAA